MSLDVYLEVSERVKKPASSRIFIRENGQTLEISEEEWNRRYPDLEPVKLETTEEETNCVYSSNITHNLGTMAVEAKIYKYLWRPEENGITKASQLISHLSTGLDLLKSDPERFKKFNPENKWGDYEAFIEFVDKYLRACIKYPDANVRVWR